MPNVVLSVPPISFQFRSPYQFQSPGQLPPTGTPAGGANVTLNDDNQLVVAGLPLQSYTSSGLTAQTDPTTGVYDRAAFGDALNVVATFPGVGLPVDSQGNPLSFVLGRAPYQRTQLLIQNNTLGALYYAFDRQADDVSCVAIPAGGSREFDSRIPQGQLSLYALGNGKAVVEYMNNDIT